MELKTDGGIYITKDLYRKYVKKIMHGQMKCASLATLFACLEGDDPDKVTGAVKDALNLQLQVLKYMEDELFGKPEKGEDEEKPQVPKKEDEKDESEKEDGNDG